MHTIFGVKHHSPNHLVVVGNYVHETLHQRLCWTSCKCEIMTILSVITAAQKVSIQIHHTTVYLAQHTLLLEDVIKQ